MRRVAVLFMAALVLAAIAGCSSDKSTNPGGGGQSTSTTYAGVFASGSESGVIHITVPNATLAPLQAASSDTVNITGTLKFSGGGTLALSGQLVRSTGYVRITGGDYTFTGDLAENEITGGYTGPNGTGGFRAEWGGAGTTTRTYLGTFAADSPDTQHGTFDMIITGSTVSVVAFDTEQTDPIYLVGTLTGSAISVHDPTIPDTPVAVGTLSGTSVSGTYTVPDHTGTWSGSLSQ